MARVTLVGPPDAGNAAGEVVLVIGVHQGRGRSPGPLARDASFRQYPTFLVDFSAARHTLLIRQHLRPHGPCQPDVMNRHDHDKEQQG